MDIFINWDNEKKSILLPVNPESFEVSGGQNNTSLHVHGLGEVNLKGKRGLYEISVESFFPGQRYDFAKGKFRKPYDYYCKKLKSLFEKNKTVHLIITKTNINMFCTIESFSYGEQERNGDVRYSLNFKEFRELVAKKRTSTKTPASTYKWKKGDTWSKVVKKNSGTSKGWKDIRKKNKTVLDKAVLKALKKSKGKKVKEEVALIGIEVRLT